MRVSGHVFSVAGWRCCPALRFSLACTYLGLPTFRTGKRRGRAPAGTRVPGVLRAHEAEELVLLGRVAEGGLLPGVRAGRRVVLLRLGAVLMSCSPFSALGNQFHSVVSELDLGLGWP